MFWSIWDIQAHKYLSASASAQNYGLGEYRFGSLWILQIYHWHQWWGAVGTYVAIGAIPVGLTLPFIYFIKTGFFSYLLFGILAGFVVASIAVTRTENIG